MNYNNIIQNFIHHSINIFDIGFITVLYFSLAYILSILIERYNGKFKKKECDIKSTFRIIIEILLNIWLLGVFVYFARLIVTNIPFPLDGFHNYKHSELKELYSPGVFIMVFLWNQNNLTNKINYLNDRIYKYIY